MTTVLWQNAFDMHVAFKCMRQGDPDKYREVYDCCKKSRRWRKWLVLECRKNPLVRLTKIMTAWP